ncbi:MAG: CoA transferase [Candidatus Rokubacteria bacterium]|nr:CoA transferase [Candidatus Rokubacteria bacterium]
MSRGEGATARPLTGVTVLDFTRVLAGPYCTRLLADLGARVIKVERPGLGDEMRQAPEQLEPGREDQSTYFVRFNAGKQSLALDLAHSLARGVVEDLAKVSDVVVENFLPGVMLKLGLDYASLSRIKPELVYCSISGYGQTGPLSDWPAFAHTIAAMAGVTHLEANREPSPRVGYFQTADVLAATHAFGAIVAALFQRSRTGRGTHIDVSMLECLVATEDMCYGSVLNGGPGIPGPRPGLMICPVAERFVALQVVGGPQFWPRLASVLGRPELARDPRFATRVARRENQAALEAIVREWIARFNSAAEALAALRAGRVPCAVVLTPEEVVAHPHMTERGAFPSVGHATRGSVRITNTPFTLSSGPLGPLGDAPYRPGEDSRTVLSELLGYAPEEIDRLVRAGAVAVPT